MGALVYNEAGADEASPCVNTVSSFFDDPKCTRTDYQKWRRAAANLYELGLLPLLERLSQVEQAKGTSVETMRLQPRVVGYFAQYSALPIRGSAFSPQRNATLVTSAIALMLEGEQTIQQLRQALIDNGVIAPPLALPPRPTTPELHSAWRAYAWHIGIGAAAVTVLGLTVWAVISARGRDAG